MTIFIIVNVLARVVERLSGLGEGSAVLAVSSLLLPLLGVLPLLKAQQWVNLSVGDPQGRNNSQLGTRGVVALLLGALAWPLLIAARLPNR